MPIHSRKNQYRGVNAHLNSVLQNEPYDWESFHDEHLGHMRDALQEQLPAGYFARLERSLQIRIQTLGDEPGESSERTRPDIFVGYVKPLREGMKQLLRPSPKSEPTVTVPMVKTLRHTDDDYLKSIIVYQVEKSGRIGIAVTRIELLSRSNKPPRPEYDQYLEKREETLRSGLRLIEIDYLHQTRSPLEILPSYPGRDPNACPYMIIVNDPRPTVAEAQTEIYGFVVDEPIPFVDIPLAEKDVLPFDFGAVYNRTFERNPYYHYVVDYEQLPERFETYSPDDQARIRARMQAVIEAHRRGIDLETGPFDIT